MKTLTEKQTLFLKPDNSYSYFQFENYGGCSNYEVVEKMAKNGIQKAINAIEKLKLMTSRERSESGIYYKLQQMPEWVTAKSQILCYLPYQKIEVTFNSEVNIISPAREAAFKKGIWALVLSPNNTIEVSVPYCYSEKITVKKEIKIIE